VLQFRVKLGNKTETVPQLKKKRLAAINFSTAGEDVKLSRRFSVDVNPISERRYTAEVERIVCASEMILTKAENI
jgi:hypothetical protein